MKAQAKRFVDHRGAAYDTEHKHEPLEARADSTDGVDSTDGAEPADESVGFLGLWRYATVGERAATAAGVLLSWVSSLAVLSAVMSYGELTAMFVQRYKGAEPPGRAFMLQLFGGGRALPASNDSLPHMDALVEDAVAFACASLAIMAVQLSAAASSVTLANWAAGRSVARLRYQLLRNVLRQEIAFFDTNTDMNFASTLTEDVDKLHAGVGEHVVMTSYLAGTVVFGAAISLSYGWQLTLVGLTIVPVAVAVAAAVTTAQTRTAAAEVSAYGAAGRVVEQALGNVRTVRAYSGEATEVARYQALLADVARLARRRGLLAGAGAGLGWLLTYSLNAVVLAYGASLIVRDMPLPPDSQEYHPSVMVIVLMLSFMAAQNIAMCHPHLEVFSSARGAARSLYRLLQRRSRIDALRDAGAKPASFRGDIQFDNVYFNYPSRPDVKVLRGLTLSVRAGESVALVGGSGCGKSTLLQLLQRMYEPDSGAVSVDGHALRDLHLHHFRTHIGVVGQEPVLFGGTIRENITLGTSASDAEMIAAAQLAHAHQFISKLADGYDTVLGERGASLSGGQKQRIAIARAVLRRPALLLLDEPTSALDPAAERQVQAALDAASRGRTTLVVSHRLSTIVNASRIVYMEQGAALEQGTHEELLALRGLYWKLHQEDLTTRSAARAAGDADADDDDVVAPPDQRDYFRRAVSRKSTAKVSQRPDSMIRGSRRFRTVSTAHVANVASPDLLEYAAPEESPEEQLEAPVSARALLALNKPEWRLLTAGALASLLIGAAMPLFAVLFSKLFGMFAASDAQEIMQQSQLYAGLFAGVAALCGAITFLQSLLFNRAGTALTQRLRERTFRNYLQQEQGWFDEQQNSVGALCARLATDCAAVQGATGTSLGTVMQGLSTMLIGVLLALSYSWKMALVSLVSVPCVIGGIYLEGWVTKRTEKLQRAALEQASRVATEALLNVRTVQSLGVEAALLARYRGALEEAARQRGGAARVRGPVYGLCLCAPTLGYAVSLSYGGHLIAREALPYEHAILVSEALIYGAWMLAEALSFAPSFAAARRSGARIVRALEREPTVVSEPTAVDQPGWTAKGELHFDDVHFRYPTRPNVPVLRGLRLRLAAGRSVALVGASGCGKSTLMHLLLRSYDPEHGKVELDGRDIKRDLTLPRLRAQLGLVQQEPALFERSIRENIAYGDTSREVSMEEIIRAAQQANVHGFIASLPEGYETRLAAGGAALSGGQKQRVAIARALVRDPRVLLLDEATSALDASSEKTVQAALEAASKDRTTVMIAHRLATVQHAHTICVIDKGAVAESGSHEELVRARGLYWELLQQQGPAGHA